MRIIIAGSRDFLNYPILKYLVNKMVSNLKKQDYDVSDITIISGNAPGADTLGEQYAKEKGYNIEIKPADWNNLNVTPCIIKKNKFGKEYNAVAGHARNEQMAVYASQDPEVGVLIAFWKNKSSGTKDMITRAKKYRLKIFVIDLDVIK